jgi:hypothetical protein
MGQPHVSSEVVPVPSPVHPYSDYGVAMRTLKSARGWLAFMLFACVMAQFIGFALMWWTPQPYGGMRPELITQKTGRATVSLEDQPASRPAATEDFFPGTTLGKKLNIRKQWDTAYTMAVPLAQIAALIGVSSHAIIVFITLLVVLVAQAPGVAQITRSLIWSVLLLFIFLPWQYFARDFPIPGVIYSYNELLNSIALLVVPAPPAGTHVYGYQIWLIYGRFIVWPIVGLLVLLITSERYRAGVMIAIGHPLQSILQPRSGGPGPLPGAPMPAGPKPRPLSVSPGNAGTRRP